MSRVLNAFSIWNNCKLQYSFFGTIIFYLLLDFLTFCFRELYPIPPTTILLPLQIIKNINFNLFQNHTHSPYLQLFSISLSHFLAIFSPQSKLISSIERIKASHVCIKFQKHRSPPFFFYHNHHQDSHSH